MSHVWDDKDTEKYTLSKINAYNKSGQSIHKRFSGGMMVDYARAIAKIALDIGAIKLWPKDGPFLWASGYHMPIYNDNRKFLGSAVHRRLIAEGMKDIIEENNLVPDLIAGTSSAGIAPASSLAQLLGVPVVIQHDGKAYSFDSAKHKGFDNLYNAYSYCGVITSTCPFGIAPAVMDANLAELPFAYVREKKKDHGLGKQIEGIVDKGQNAVLIDLYRGASYLEDAKAALENEGVNILACFTKDISDLMKEIDVSGKTIVQVEDLVSTAGSCVKEIESYEHMGADVLTCISIFSYGLDKALQQFKDARISLQPLLEYPDLISVALERGVIPDDSRKALEDWRADPFNWGERHGYPPVKK